jgi:uncharacterized protein (TIGR04255 family)
MATASTFTGISGLSETEEEALFHDYPKVRYGQNPLDSVVAEVRFPPILRIETEVPAKFQDALAGEFPLFTEVTPINLGSPEMVRLFQSANIFPTAKTFTFSSADNEWSLVLSRESLSLTCRKYTRWDDFRKKWERPLDALLKTYEPQFYVRVGLRYRDVISRERLGLQDVSWNKLLQPGIVGEIHTPIAPLLVTAWHQIVFKLQKENTQVLLQHGLQPVPPNGEGCYIFDSDFSTESRLEPQNAIHAFRYFNKRSWYFFRACIADRLHDAMQPESI